MSTAGTINSPTGFSAYTDYTIASFNLNSVMRRLAQGTKSVVDDGAGVAISERMRSQATSSNMAMHNTENGVSLLQTADTWMQQISDHLARMHELAISAADGTKTSTDKTNLQTEFSALQSEVQRITGTAAKFNGQTLFDTTFSGGKSTQVGADSGQTINITLANLASNAGTVVSTGFNWSVMADSALSVTNLGAGNLVEGLQAAINFISKERASVGAQQSRFEKTRNALVSYENQIRSAENKVRSIDTAREAADLTKYQILNQISTAMMAQANQMPAGAVQLVG